MVQCSDIHKKERQIEIASIDDIQNVKPEPVVSSSINSHNSIKVAIFNDIIDNNKIKKKLTNFFF